MTHRFLVVVLAILLTGCTKATQLPPSSDAVGTTPGLEAPANTTSTMHFEGKTGIGACVVVVPVTCPEAGRAGNPFDISHDIQACRLRVVVNWTPQAPTNDKLIVGVTLFDARKAVNSTQKTDGHPLTLDIAVPGALNWSVGVLSEQREDAGIGYGTYEIPQDFNATVTVFRGPICAEAPANLTAPSRG